MFCFQAHGLGWAGSTGGLDSGVCVPTHDSTPKALPMENTDSNMSETRSNRLFSASFVVGNGHDAGVVGGGAQQSVSNSWEAPQL